MQAGPLHLHAAFVSNIIDLVESFSFCIVEDISEIFCLCSLELKGFSEIWVYFRKRLYFLFPSGRYLFLRLIIFIHLLCTKAAIHCWVEGSFILVCFFG